ncbi:MAG: cytochrome c maturation protein CcmE [Rhodocyclaceae bacterium]|nr:cytochrome c maturation protein CcmE [Rhodocyclaceae bacterium]
MKPRHQRALLIVGGLAALGVAAYFVLRALESNIAFFISPAEVVAGKAPKDKVFRIGGMVKEGSLHRQDLTVRFVITDTAADIPVVYTGILPDLFAEGKGAVAQGKLREDGVFHATEVLAKHDENYMPPEAAHALEQAQKAQRTLAKP